MTHRLFSAALLCAAVPAMAQPMAPKTPPQAPCLQQMNIYDYQPVAGNRSLIVIDRARRRYRLNFFVPCYNLQYHMGLRFKTFAVGGLSCVAKGDSVLLHDPVGPGQCLIRDIQYQTPEMDRADALAARAGKSH